MPALAVEPVSLRLRRPLRAAWGELTERTLLKVRLSWADGSTGEGEAAPLEPYDGARLQDVRAALDAYRIVLAGMADTTPHEDLLAACAEREPLPQALAAVDLALWDRAARMEGLPVSKLIAPGSGAAVTVNATISADDREGAATQAARAAAAGFVCVKVKVGIGDDAGRVAAVRAAIGPNVAIRVDANGAWRDAREALANLRALVPAGIELAEEPVHGLEAMRELRAASPIPIGMDETAALPGAVGSQAADAVCLKVARCGGLTALLRDARTARAAGSYVWVASNFDGPAGIAAGLHAASVLALDGPLPACGLATLGLFTDAEDPFPPHNGEMPVPSGAGLMGMPRATNQEA